MNIDQPYLVPTMMGQLINEYNNEKNCEHIVEKMVLFHLKFESIHPFIHGNGRTGRLILNLELMKEGYPPINIKFKDRKKYYDSFADYHRKSGDYSMLTEMIAKYVEEGLKRYISVLEIANNIDG